MAYRRSIVARTKSFYHQQQRLAPSFSYISTKDREEFHTNSSTSNSEIRSYIHNRFLITGNNSCNSQLSRYVFPVRQSQIGVGYGLVSRRSMSSASDGERVPSEIEDLKNTEVLNDMVGVVGDKAVEVAPVVNEVAIAAADSFFPVAALQYLVDYVHCFTGFNWWASIVVTTLLFRLIQFPIHMYLRKAVVEHFAFISQQLLFVKKGLKRDKLQNLDDPRVSVKGFAVFNNIVNKIGKPLLVAWIISECVIPLTFFFSILNMAEKVPSFVTGGPLWFTDLTSPDRICLPVLFALASWINFGLTARNKKMSHFVGALVLLGTVTLGFPKAIYFYWITQNLSSMAIIIVTRDPRVLKWLGVSTGKKTP